MKEKTQLWQTIKQLYQIIIFIAKRVTDRVGGAQCRVHRGANCRVSIWCCAPNTRTAQRDANLNQGLYIYGSVNWLHNKTIMVHVCHIVSPSSLLLSASVTNSTLQIWNLSRSLNHHLKAHFHPGGFAHLDSLNLKFQWENITSQKRMALDWLNPH